MSESCPRLSNVNQVADRLIEQITQVCEQPRERKLYPSTRDGLIQLQQKCRTMMNLIDSQLCEHTHTKSILPTTETTDNSSHADIMKKLDEISTTQQKMLNRTPVCHIDSLDIVEIAENVSCTLTSRFGETLKDVAKDVPEIVKSACLEYLKTHVINIEYSKTIHKNTQTITY